MKKSKLFEGQKAPTFIASSTAGEFNLECLEEKWLVLYFYPKDLTAGCTIEAKGFSELINEFKKFDVKVIGVSRDTLSSHERFIETECINFDLISDSQEMLCKEYGVCIDKTMLGNRYSDFDRTTFLIDRNKIIRRIWKKVFPSGHAAKVLETIKILNMVKINPV